MADNNVQDQDAVEDDEQVNQQEGETPEGEEDQHEPEADEGDADDEVVVTIGEESPPHNEDEVEGQPAPKWVKDLRKRERELARENRELKAAQAAAKPQQAAPKLGARPTLQDEDVNYDEDILAEKLEKWLDDKRTVADAAKKQEQEAAEQQAEHNGKLSAYKTAAKELRVSDFEESEAVVAENFSQLQQNIMLDAVSSPAAQAQLVSALGKNESRLKQLASIKNHIKFAVALSELEKQLKVTNRKAPPAPEKVVRGNSTAIGVNDPKLARLEAAADKSGDRTELVAYKKHLKAKAD